MLWIELSYLKDLCELCHNGSTYNEINNLNYMDLDHKSFIPPDYKIINFA